LLDQLRAGIGTLAGAGTNRLNLVHRDDIVAAILACLAAPGVVADEVFNVSDGAPVPKAEMVAWLAGRLGRPAPGFDGIQPASPRRGGEPVPDRIVSNALLGERLGWRPRYPDYRAGYEQILGRG